MVRALRSFCRTAPRDAFPVSGKPSCPFGLSERFTAKAAEDVPLHNACLVLSDSPRKITGGRTWPLVDEETADFSFIRFHGSLAMYASGYTDGELTGYADMIHKKMAKGKDVFCYFNNDIVGYAVKDGKRLMELV